MPRAASCGLLAVLLRGALDGQPFEAPRWFGGQEERDAGWTNVVLRTDPVNEPWNVWVIDDAGRQVSPTVNVVTDTKSCQPTGTGHQVATIVFVKG